MTAAPRGSASQHDIEVSARFDATAARFKPTVGGDDPRLTALTRAIGPMTGLRVLDLGCGKGRFATHLVEHGAEVVGIDLSAEMLAEARGINRARASARRLPFANGTFDAVIAVEVIEHVGPVGPVLAEAKRVLRPGGQLAIIDKNALALDARRPWLPAIVIKWIDQRRGLWMYPLSSPVRERWFVPRWLQRQLRDQGFATVRLNFLLSAGERQRWCHRLIPSTRLLTLWAAQVEAQP